MMTPGSLGHIRQAERPVLNRLRQQAEQSVGEYRPISTAFLDPRAQFLAAYAAEEVGAVCHTFGGFSSAEWRRCLFAPDYFVPEQADYEVVVLELKYATKYLELHHSNIMGTLIHNGVTREAFGDIVTDGERWQFATTTAMAQFIQGNVDHVGSAHVQFLEAETLLQPRSDWQPHEVLSASLRIDALVGEVFKVSRQQAKTLVNAGQVTLNWLPETHADAQITPTDMISVRGFGRIQVVELLGLTQKDKWRVAVNVIDKRHL